MSWQIPKTSFLKKNPEKAEKFLRAVKRGYEYLINETSTASAQALAPSFVGMTIEELEIAVEQYVAINAWSSDMVLTEESFNRLVDVLNNASATPYSPDYTALVNNSFAIKLSEEK